MRLRRNTENILGIMQIFGQIARLSGSAALGDGAAQPPPIWMAFTMSSRTEITR
jgi:hypothetical protein